MKHGCDWNGYFGGRPRLPLIALNDMRKSRFKRYCLRKKALGGLRPRTESGPLIVFVTLFCAVSQFRCGV